MLYLIESYMKTNGLIIAMLGVGIIASLCMYRYARSAQGENMRRAMMQKLQESNKWAEHLVEHTRQKAMEVGVGTADRISQKARDAAERMQRHMNAIAVE